MSDGYDVVKETIERLAALNARLVNKGDDFDEKDAADVDAAIVLFRSGHKAPYDLSVEAAAENEINFTERFYSGPCHAGMNEAARERIGRLINTLSR